MHLFLAATLTVFNYVNVPTAEMREQPSTESELVSSAYYSEPINVLEEKNEWVKIETMIDHYQGWTKKNALIQSQETYPSESAINSVIVNRCAAHVYHLEDTVYGPILTLPFETVLEFVSQAATDSRWLKIKLLDGRDAYIQRGDVTFSKKALTLNEMCLLSLKFLDLPYTWAGRNSFGYDCSGFTQMLYRQMKISIPRDAKHQIHWDGFVPVALNDLKSGDLIFFGVTEEKITHVGMSLGDDRFIHAAVPSKNENAAYLRISRITDPDWNGSGRHKYRAARTLKDL